MVWQGVGRRLKTEGKKYRRHLLFFDSRIYQSQLQTLKLRASAILWLLSEVEMSVKLSIVRASENFCNTVGL